MQTISVNKAFEKFSAELETYYCNRLIKDGIVLHLAPLSDSTFWVGTLTAYDKRGLKSESAFPFRQFIKVVNELEQMMDKFHKPFGFTGCLVGWSPPANIKEFLYKKKVHRAFILHESQVAPFLMEYASPEHQTSREVDVVLVVG